MRSTPEGGFPRRGLPPKGAGVGIHPDGFLASVTAPDPDIPKGVDYAAWNRVLHIWWGVVERMLGKANPGHQSQTLKPFGNTPYTKSPVTAFNEFSESLRSFLPKELAFQGVDDVIRSGGISIPVELFDAHYFDRMRK